MTTEEFLANFQGSEIYVSSSDIDIPATDPKYKLRSNPWHIHETFEESKSKLIKANEERRGIFFCVNELDRSLDSSKKRTKKMFVRARAIWVEDDNVSDSPRTDWPLKPNIIVNSSPGKYHYYWLTSTRNASAWENVMKRMVQDYKCDNQAKDLVRVLRLPGFFHHKKEPPHLVTYEQIRKDPYEWEAIETAFPPITGEIKLESRKASSGVMPGMSIAELSVESDNGHLHGPSRALAMKLANYGLPKGEALAIMQRMFPEHHDGHHEQSLDTAYAKVESEKNGTDEEVDLPEAREQFSYEIEYPPGLLGELAKECYEMAFYPNRKVAVVTAIGLVAGISGRVFNVSRMGLNLYIAIMMDTGTGKDIINKVINSALYGLPLASGRTFVGDSGFTGAKAFRQNLEEGRSKISVITEAGLFGRSTSGDKETLRRDMLDAFTKSGKDSYLGALRYSAKENSLAAIRAPAFSIIFESTQKSFMDSLKHSEAKISGELARMWILRIKDQIPYPNKKVRRKFSDHLIARLQQIATKAAAIQMPENDVNIDKEVIELEFSDKIGYEQMCKFVDMRNQEDPESLKAVMLSRAWEKAIRIAAIISVFDKGIETKEVTEEAFEWTLKNVINPELESVDAMFREGASDDVLDVIRGVVAPAISKILRGTFKDTKNNAPGPLGKVGIFTRTNLMRVLKNHQAVCEMSSRQDGSNAKHGIDKLIDYMVDRHYLTVPSQTDILAAGGSARVKEGLAYRITSELKAIMEL